MEASPIAFVNGGFDSNDFGGWTVATSGHCGAVVPFETVAGQPSGAAAAPYSAGLGNYGDACQLDLRQTVLLTEPLYLHIRADVAAETTDTNFYATFAPIFGFAGATFGFSQPALYFFPPETGTLRAVAEGIVFAQPGTYEIGFRFGASTSGPRGTIGGTAYLDNAVLLTASTLPVGEFQCGDNGGTRGCPQNVVPEPISFVLLGSGLGGGAILRWRRREHRAPDRGSGSAHMAASGLGEGAPARSTHGDARADRTAVERGANQSERAGEDGPIAGFVEAR